MFNLNTSRKPEYQLQGNLIDEHINTFGIKVKFLKTEKKNADQTFRDFTHNVLKETTEIFILPENTEAYDNPIYTSWGLTNNTVNNFYISGKTIEHLKEFGIEITDLPNSLLVLPSSQIIEITHIEPAQSMNYLWSYGDKPTAFVMTCREYNIQESDKLSMQDTIEDVTSENSIIETDEEIDTQLIDDFFKEVHTMKEIQDETDNISDDSDNTFKKGNLYDPDSDPFGELS